MFTATYRAATKGSGAVCDFSATSGSLRRLAKPPRGRVNNPLQVDNLHYFFMKLPSNAALILIDLQNAIDHPSWGERNNPHAEKNVAALLAAWRASGRPIYHIRHDSVEPNSHYRPGQNGNNFKPEAMPLPGEIVITKQTNSAFIGTGLEARLRQAGQTTLVIAGVITNNSVEATVRMAGNLGFNTFLVEDATFTFGKKHWPASEVHAMSLANLDGEYCTVVRTEEVLA